MTWDSRRACRVFPCWGARLGCHDDSEDGLGEALVLRMGSILASPEGVCGFGRTCALGVGFTACLWVALSEGAHLGCHDDSEHGLGEILALRWPAFLLLERRCAEWVRGVRVGIPMLGNTLRLPQRHLR